MNAGKAGEWAFLISVVISIIAALAAVAAITSEWVALLLVILGIIVGLLNVSEKETTAFLIASVALIIAGLGANIVGSAGVFSALGVGILAPLATFLNSLFGHIAVFVAPAAAIVAVKAIVATAKK